MLHCIIIKSNVIELYLIPVVEPLHRLACKIRRIFVYDSIAQVAHRLLEKRSQKIAEFAGVCPNKQRGGRGQSVLLIEVLM